MIDGGMMSALGLLIPAPAHPVFLIEKQSGKQSFDHSKVDRFFCYALNGGLSHAELNLTFTREQSLYL